MLNNEYKYSLVDDDALEEDAEEVKKTEEGAEEGEAEVTEEVAN